MICNYPTTPAEKLEALQYCYDGWLHSRDLRDDTILCQQVGQILGFPVKEGLGE